MLVDLGGHVHLSLPSTQLNDLLLCFSKNLYLREQLMIDLHYCLSLAFRGIAMDGDQFLLAVCMCPLFAQLSSQVDHHLDELSSREYRQFKFVRSAGIMMGGILVRHGCRVKVF